MDTEFTPAEKANFAAAKAVGYATAFLDGRADADALHTTARSVLPELLLIGDEDIHAKAIRDVTHLLVIAMLNASVIKDTARLDRWQQVMGALVELARMEARKLRETGAQRA